MLFGFMNFCLFLAFPLFCFFARDYKEVNDMLFKIVPWVRASFAYMMLYIYSHRGVNIDPSTAKRTWATIKYFIGAFGMVIIKNLVFCNDLKEAQNYIVKGEFLESYGQ